jgi:hypothetical protein
MTNHVDVLITTIEDMAALYGIGCGQWSPEQIDKGEMGEITAGPALVRFAGWRDVQGEDRGSHHPLSRQL